MKFADSGIIPFDREKYKDGALVLQSWYHPDNIPKDPLDEEENKRAAAISGTADTDVTGIKATTVSGSSASDTSGKSVTTISGKAEKED